MRKIPCSIIRGGTSKGIFVLDQYLPDDGEQRDRWLLGMMGSADPRQIDGLGGADPLTSKVAIVSASAREGIDLEYESVEVGIGEGFVNHGIMCGNLLAGVGYFAIAEGLIQPTFPATTVRIFCRSNQKTVVAVFPVTETVGQPASVNLLFESPGGAVSGKLQPLNEPVSTVRLDTQSLKFSLIDAGTLYAFIKAEDLGVSGGEDPVVLDANKPFRATIELARQKITERFNQGRTERDGLLEVRRLKIAIVSRPMITLGNAAVVARVINPAKVHKAFAVSGGISLAAAAAVPRTVVNDMVKPCSSPFLLQIVHPSGVLHVTTHFASGAAGTKILSAEVQRTARVIMRGMSYVPSLLPELSHAV